MQGLTIGEIVGYHVAAGDLGADDDDIRAMLIRQGDIALLDLSTTELLAVKGLAPTRRPDRQQRRRRPKPRRLTYSQAMRLEYDGQF